MRLSDISTWEQYERIATVALARFENKFRLCKFDYIHPTRLQPSTPRRFKADYPVPVAYAEWGDSSNPTLICMGGIANTAMRFNFLADELSSKNRFHVVCMDWLGRGTSGWLAEENHYSLATCIEQLHQLIRRLDKPAVSLLGSSLGGSVAIGLIARHARQVDRLILNDIGPFIPVKRRQRRAQALARHYVFRTPQELLHRVGASQKNDGPVSDAVRLHNIHHMTRWSEVDGGRIYVHDPRAMQAFRQDAQKSLSQWVEWERVSCPVLVIHGTQSDVLFPWTIARLRRNHDVTVMHVPDTGHTPVLCDPNQLAFIDGWLNGAQWFGNELTVLHAPTL